jgi:mannose-1-phosphate guanylyltransferase
MHDDQPPATAINPSDPLFAFGSPFETASATAPGEVGTLPAEQPAAEAELETELTMWAVVFAGGIGSRFWPLSTPERPKQLLSLVGERPLIADTVARLAPAIPPDRVLVLTSADIADALHAAIPEVPWANMLVEPRPMGTAAALAWGAQEIARRVGPKTVFCALHADLAVGYPDEFRRTLQRAAAHAVREPVLVALGVEPTRPETGFGYLVPSDAGNGGRPSPQDARPVARVIEKPGPILAEELIDQGALWNAGIYVWQAGVVLDALQRHTPELHLGLAALAAGKLDRFAGLVQSVSIERGLLERSHDVVAVAADCGWDDVGTWASLRRVRELDDTGNGVWGEAHLVDSSSCVVHSEGGTVVLYGLSGMLVVTRPGLTFVTTLDRATELNPLLDALPSSLAGRPRRENPLGEPPPDSAGGDARAGDDPARDADDGTETA